MALPLRLVCDPQTTSLAAGRQFIETNLQQGAVGSFCPCCQRQVVLRRRKIDSTAVRIMLELYRYYCDRENERWQAYHAVREPGVWVHIPDFLTKHPDESIRRCVQSREYSRVKHWQLLIPRPSTSAGDGHAGFYRLTDRGVQFVCGRLRVSRWAWVYNDRAYGFSGRHGGRFGTDMVNIQQALGDDFVYAEIIPPGYPHRSLPEIDALGRARMRMYRSNA